MLSEQSLSFRREKQSSIITSVAYRLFRLTNSVFGPARMLKFWLEATRLSHRFAHEAAGLVHGDKYYSLNHAPFKDWIKEGSKVIDIGCGDGRWSAMVSEFAAVTGIDSNPVKIETAKKRGSTANFMVGRADTVNGDFDTAILIHVLEHIDRPVEFLQSLDVSTVVIEVPDFDSDILNYIRLENGTPFYSDADHVREYTEELLREHLDRSGWKITHLLKSGGTISARAEKSARPD